MYYAHFNKTSKKMISSGEAKVLGENFVNIEVNNEILQDFLADSRKYILSEDGKTLITNPEYSEILKNEEKKRIQGLFMTPLDFLKALEKFANVTYEQILELCASNPEVDRELKFCQHVYRNNPMLDALAPKFNVTSEQLDQMFVEVDKIKQQARII